MNLNIPTKLTLARVLAIPLMAVVFYLPIPYASIISSCIFIVAAITDWLDGYLARRWDESSPFGAFLDPVADKLIVATALVMLVQADSSLWVALPAVVIICREITISALREWMAELGKRGNVAVNSIGKFKTATQMIAIILMLWRESLFSIPVYTLGIVLLWVSGVLTVWSMMVYIKAAIPLFKEEA